MPLFVSAVTEEFGNVAVADAVKSHQSNAINRLAGHDQREIQSVVRSIAEFHQDAPSDDRTYNPRKIHLLLVKRDSGNSNTIDNITTPDTNNEPTTDINTTNEPTTDINTCLLYTSPSPRDATLSRMPSSA